MSNFACRFNMGQLVSVVSTKPVRDFVGPVAGVHFADTGIISYDVRDPYGNVVVSIDHIDVHDATKHNHPRVTRAMKETA